MHYLSTEARKQLDEAGLKNAFITVSNDLDEYIIETLVKDGAPIDSWGVGTRMVTGGQAANIVCSAFPGVYKLAARIDGENTIPVMKVSDNPEKTTNPGIKQVWRIKDKSGAAIVDVLGIEGHDDLRDGQRHCFWHHSADYRHFNHTIDGSAELLLKKRMEDGRLTKPLSALDDIKARVQSDLESFDSTYKRLLNPHVYKISITDKLRDLKLELIQKRLGDREE